MGRLRRLINFAAPAILAGALFTAGSGNMQAACNLNSSGGQIKRVIYITFDNATLFGTGSKEDIAVRAALALPNTPENQPARQEPSTDYLGIAMHCAKGSALCKNHHARPDPLPVEPGGYGHPGFPNLFNPRATPSLDYATTMIEAGHTGHQGQHAVRDRARWERSFRRQQACLGGLRRHHCALHLYARRRDQCRPQPASLDGGRKQLAVCNP